VVRHWFDDEHGMGSNLGEVIFNFLFVKKLVVAWIWKGRENPKVKGAD